MVSILSSAALEGKDDRSVALKETRVGFVEFGFVLVWVDLRGVIAKVGEEFVECHV
jgi:hypothetical protein